MRPTCAWWTSSIFNGRVAPTFARWPRRPCGGSLSITPGGAADSNGRGGGQKVPLDSGAVISSGPDESLLALEEVLCRLASLSPRRARVVELRFFGGLSVDEAAEILGVSPRTVDNDWTFAKTWLHREMMRGSST